MHGIRKQLLAQAEKFDGSASSLKCVLDTLKDAKLETRSKYTYLAHVRKFLVDQGFMGHHEPEFKARIATLKEQFPEEYEKKWESRSNADKFKVFKAARARVQGGKDSDPATEFEKLVGQLGYVPAAFASLALPRQLEAELRATRRQSRQHKFSSENLLRIRDPQGFLGVIATQLRSDEACLLFPALLVVSGLRVSDIYYGAQLQPVEGQPFQALTHSALKRGSRLSDEPKKGVIHLCCTFSLLDNGLQKFRKQFPNVQTSHQASTLRGPTNKKWCLAAFGNHVQNLYKCHQLRAVYAKLVYILWGREEHESSFYKKNLLHDSDTVSAEYETVKIPEDHWSALKPIA